MAEWGRGGDDDRRGRGWRPVGFYPDQYQPFNPFFFPGFGFDPYQQQVGAIQSKGTLLEGSKSKGGGGVLRISKIRELGINNNRLGSQVSAILHNRGEG
jgi:hypothetical protein